MRAHEIIGRILYMFSGGVLFSLTAFLTQAMLADRNNAVIGIFAGLAATSTFWFWRVGTLPTTEAFYGRSTEGRRPTLVSIAQQGTED